MTQFEAGYSYFGEVQYLTDEEYLFPVRKDAEKEYVSLNRYGKELIPPIFDNIDCWIESIIDGSVRAYKEDKNY